MLFSFQPQPRQYNNVTAFNRPRKESPLHFRPLDTADIAVIRPYLESAPARTCDYTIGGLLMWTDYFKYTYAVWHDTLFIKGVTEDDVTRTAFSIPVGRMPLQDSVRLLREYCASHGYMPLTFSAVPEVCVEPLRMLGASEVTPLVNWGDYLYEAEALASLSGKKLGKKRNHVNRFIADNPGYTFEPLSRENLDKVKAFYRTAQLAADKPALAEVEREQVMRVLDHVDRYPFEGAVLSTPAHGVVAFTLGEVIGDTLFTHIEKMNHLVAGAGETVNKLFAEMILGRHRDLRYINREEDVGDPGLRHAKESYHPALILKKYNVTF